MGRNTRETQRDLKHPRWGGFALTKGKTRTRRRSRRVDSATARGKSSFRKKDSRAPTASAQAAVSRTSTLDYGINALLEAVEDLVDELRALRGKRPYGHRPVQTR